MSIQLVVPLILVFNIFKKNGHFGQLLMWVRLRWMTLGWLKEVFPTVSTSRTEILAQEIVKDYPDYDVIFWDDCQKFVAYLLETASPGRSLGEDDESYPQLSTDKGDDRMELDEQDDLVDNVVLSAAIEEVVAQTMEPSDDYYTREGMDVSAENGYFAVTDQGNMFDESKSIFSSLSLEHVKESFKSL
jgi:hypothetical protein